MAVGTWSSLVVVLVVALALTREVTAVDKTNFKTCEQSGFCKRLRTAPASAFAVDATSVRVDEARGTLVARLVNTAPERPADDGAAADASGGGVDSDADGGATGHSSMDYNARELELTLVHDGTISRAQLREVSPAKPRYELTDSLVREFASASAAVTVSRSASEVTLTATATGAQVTVTVGAAFELRWRDSAGRLVARAGGRGGLAFESVHAAAAAGTPRAAAETAAGMWTETFKGTTDSKPHGPQAVMLDVEFPAARALHGIPEHASAFALGDTRSEPNPFRLYNLDVFEYELGSPAALYGSVPLLWAQGESTTGLFWHNAAETWIDLYAAPLAAGEPALAGGPAGGRGSRWISETGIIDLFVLFGPTPDAALAQYASLTGPAFLPPRFSLGFHQCRWNYKSEDDVAAVHAGFDAHDIPLDVLWLDIEHTDGKRYFTWDAVHFPQPTQMLDALAARGRSLVTIVDPHIKRDTGYHVYTDAQREQLFVRTREGNEYGGFCWPGDSAWPDFLDPRVREFWARQFSYASYRGSAANLHVWNDMNEPSVFSGPEITFPKDVTHLGGTVESRAVHNIYGMLTHSATAEGLRARDTPSRRSFVLTRAFFAGTQRTAAVWTGDNAAQWSHLAASIPMLLAHSVAGIPFIGADVGGFFGDPSPTLLARWHQAAALQPFMRAHAHIDTKRREPWLFGEPTVSLIRAAIRRRYAFMPLLYTLFEEASRTLAPPMRPMHWLEPADASLWAIESQFMVGTAVLVAPVLADEQLLTPVTLPGRDSVWYDIDTYAAFDGGNTFTIQTPLEKSPAFFRGGAIVPMKLRARRSVAAMAADPFTLVVALARDGTASGTLYLDDGESFAHQNDGRFAARAFTFADNTLRASVDSTRAAARTAFPTAERIERVVVLGSSASRASVTVDGATRALEVVRGDGFVTIRDPRVGILADFAITLA